ncbi:N-acetylglucosamine kinase-like BadF-type ATPase [Chitinophaga skermanii]|uniref:N-acetylglucosamine kinase-like BadF-type ATPase n=1 Tax=Chitinophaga skermanii TaxID=331697 RepID=A0A327QDJ5_9BACT|nr:N-acetylglucosamine kinase [Chitinophaga skermanii]RAJ02550.1 N-acetylglucosamine kinase-like BadF-type ATPase [Chitinophaga skermanii]
MPTKVALVADSGSTKTEWCLMNGDTHASFFTQGISPYFQTGEQIINIIEQELLPQLPHKLDINAVHYYGTGCASPKNASLVQDSLKSVWNQAHVEVNHDLMAAARGLCGHEKGIASILGTGSNSCYYDGKEIIKNNPGLGYILGDEGSGAYLGKKVIQYYLYNTFDEELRFRFDDKFKVSKDDILDNVYRKPLANRYLSTFAPFLSENRGHFMVENILEDCLNEFFFNHIYKYRESWTVPLYFTGSVAWHFKDILQELCDLYELQLGSIQKSPMDGLIAYHK